MWFSTWLLLLGLAAAGILNALWYELHNTRNAPAEAPVKLRTP